jgi:hypothetical protein
MTDLMELAAHHPFRCGGHRRLQLTILRFDGSKIETQLTLTAHNSEDEDHHGPCRGSGTGGDRDQERARLARGFAITARSAR